MQTMVPEARILQIPSKQDANEQPRARSLFHAEALRTLTFFGPSIRSPHPGAKKFAPFMKRGSTESRLIQFEENSGGGDRRTQASGGTA